MDKPRRPRTPYHGESDLPRLETDAERLRDKIDAIDKLIQDHFDDSPVTHLGRIGSGSPTVTKSLNKQREKKMLNLIEAGNKRSALARQLDRREEQIGAVNRYPRRLANYERLMRKWIAEYPSRRGVTRQPKTASRPNVLDAIEAFGAFYRVCGRFSCVQYANDHMVECGRCSVVGLPGGLVTTAENEPLSNDNNGASTDGNSTSGH